MRFAEDNKDFLVREYVENDRSTYWISEKLGTYPNKVRRALKFLGVDLKSKSEAQSNALKSGRHKHPTKGRKRTEEERIKISEGMANHWENMPEEERERRIELAKRQWDEMTENEKFELRSMAAEAVRRASQEGSKIEKFLKQGLTSEGYDVIFHMKGLIPAENLEVDLFVPSLKTAIEIDGPAHFLPIWGEDSLQKNIRSDAKKSGLILSKGYCMIRVKQINKNIYEKNKRQTLSLILTELNKISKKFPVKSKRYIEIEA